MKRILGAVAFTALLTIAPAPAQSGDKITICHVPPGNPENAHTITISVSAWPAHEAHGDSQQACETSPG